MSENGRIDFRYFGSDAKDFDGNTRMIIHDHIGNGIEVTDDGYYVNGGKTSDGKHYFTKEDFHRLIELIAMYFEFNTIAEKVHQFNGMGNVPIMTDKQAQLISALMCESKGIEVIRNDIE